MMPSPPLAGQAMTPKQAAFVSEYMIDHNGTQAAIRAGYSARTARQQAVELLATDDIRKAIQAAEDKAKQRNAITFDDLLEELEQARQQALCNGQAAAMVSATLAKAKMLGFDKPQTQPTGGGLSGLIKVIFDEGGEDARWLHPTHGTHGQQGE